MIKKFWNDPVWSKVIAVGIVALITLISTKLYSVSKGISFKEAIDKILEIKIAVVYVIFALIVYWIFSRIFRKVFIKEKTYLNIKQEKFKTFNRMTDPSTGILLKWGVYFDDDSPFIDDLTAFCTKHGNPPIRFINECCPMQGCENSFQRIDEYTIKNYIESDLIDRWEKE